MEYKVVGCPKCKRLQMTSSNSRIMCKYCGKSTSTNKLHIFFSSSKHSEALQALYRHQGLG